MQESQDEPSTDNATEPGVGQPVDWIAARDASFIVFGLIAWLVAMVLWPVEFVFPSLVICVGTALGLIWWNLYKRFERP